MKVGRAHIFDGTGHICHFAHKEVRTEDPLAKQPDLRCMGCGEYLEIAEKELVELMTRHLVGIVCPKCGKEQAAGPVSRFCMVDLGPGSSKSNLLCGALACEKEAYWAASPDVRLHKYRWIDDHATLCDACALILEDAHAAALRKVRYEKHRGPKDWSPKGEMPARGPL